jgi:hypothetical protein
MQAFKRATPCPKCNAKPNAALSADGSGKTPYEIKDGGSLFCPKCDVVYHLCGGVEIAYGSPGPGQCYECLVRRPRCGLCP